MKGFCVICNSPLTPGLIRNNVIRCSSCRLKSNYESLTCINKLKDFFQKEWALNLYLRYSNFLKQGEFTLETEVRNLQKAKKFYQLVEEKFFSPDDISLNWIEEIKISKQVDIRASLIAFLISEKIIKPETIDERIQASIERMIERTSKGFKRVIEIFHQERLAVRKKHISNNARNPLSMLTIKSDLEVFTRFFRWISDNHPSITSVELLQDDHVLGYLTTLTFKHREIVKKDLYMLFKIAKKRHLIAHIPIIDTPSREYSGTLETLSYEEQKRIAKIIQDKVFEDPAGSLISHLCFYHGLSSSEIRNIKVKDIDLETQKIHFENRPPAFLSNTEMILLKEYATLRSQLKNFEQRVYLFLGACNNSVFNSRPVSKKFIADKTKELTGCTPKKLRITCFNAYVQRYGPQMLIDAFGLSLTQASRYGRFEEYLIEEEIKDQIRNLNVNI